MTDRGLGVTELAGGGRERPVPGDGAQDEKSPDLQHVVILT